ncbi:hypothetical protein [Aureimonas sp. Leaf324]|uniref:hypothetical protein n=1 Tax=Aureimonas sp. Leaf324 TaxID=1736336 RepID=UPI000B1BFE5D|nr:hypothetical protein [Aureimonas sp. Leaf324]
METLDQPIVDHLFERLLTTELPVSNAGKRVEVDGQIIALLREATDAKNQFKRLYRMVEDALPRWTTCFAHGSPVCTSTASVRRRRPTVCVLG